MSVNSLTLLSLVSCALAVSLPGVSATASAPDGAGGVQSLAAVRREAAAAVRREIGNDIEGLIVEAAELDSRLRLAPCPAGLAVKASAPRGAQSRVLVRVSCSGGAHWTLNVPVDLHRKSDVLILRRAVARGESIASGDVQLQSRVLPGLSSPYVSKVSDLAGRLTRRPIPEGALLTADALDAALLIYRGQNVTLAAQAAGLEVRAPGLALANASARQRVRVRNLVSLKVVEGIAETAGVVRVNP